MLIIWFVGLLASVNWAIELFGIETPVASEFIRFKLKNKLKIISKKMYSFEIFVLFYYITK